MFADEENEKSPSETESGDVGETQQMNQKSAEEPKPKRKKAADEWQTVVGTPRAPKSASPSPAPAEPAAPPPASPPPAKPATPPPAPPPMPSAAERTVVEPLSGTGPGAGGSVSAPPLPQPAARPAQPMPRASEMPPAQPMAAGSPAVQPSAAQGGLGGLLSKIGINDPNTQRIVMIGGGSLIFLCCACACIGVVLSAMSNSGSF